MPGVFAAADGWRSGQRFGQRFGQWQRLRQRFGDSPSIDSSTDSSTDAANPSRRAVAGAASSWPAAGTSTSAEATASNSATSNSRGPSASDSQLPQLSDAVALACRHLERALPQLQTRVLGLTANAENPCVMHLSHATSGWHSLRGRVATCDDVSHVKILAFRRFGELKYPQSLGTERLPDG